jgi:hypothetical protein
MQNHTTLTAWLLPIAAAFALTFSTLPTPTALAADDDHKHKEADKHKDGDEHAGPRTDLGTAKIGGFDVQVTRLGEIKPGEESIFIIKPTGGTGQPKSVRAWIGVETGQGSIKTKAEEEKEGEWHAHHQVSKPIPAKSKLWVELETGTTKARGFVRPEDVICH